MEDELNITLSPDNIIGFFFTTKGYVEENNDRRKKPTFYWKAFHLYPVVIGSEDDYFNVDEEWENVDLAICAEGGDKDSYNFVPMNTMDLKQFLRDNTEFRLVNADDILTDASIL